MAKNKDVVSFKKYRRKWTWNVGALLFGVVFLYLIATILLYATQKRTVSYEVREGSILKDTACTGMILRQEMVVNAEQSGYVNYFLEEGQKAAVGTNVYMLTPEKLSGAQSEDNSSNEEVSLSAEDWESIAMNAQSFHDSFRPAQFDAALALRQSTSAILNNKTTQDRVTQLNTILQDGSIPDAALFQAADDGIIVYSTDGYESLTLGDVTDEQLRMADYTRNILTNNREVQAGDPVYKLVVGEEWTLVIPLTEEMEDLLWERIGDRESTSIRVRFIKDNETMVGELRIYNRGEDEAYGYLTFHSSMVRYITDRYLDIELILEDESGLKIPKSAVTKKEFYIVPEDFLTTGGASKENGVLRESEKGSVEFVPAEVFYRNAESGMVYLDKSLFSAGDRIRKQESTETFQIGLTDSLQGVYNINRGYAVFKQVEILCESEEYYIVTEGNSYGLSNYDHIALDGSSVQEDDVVNQ